MSKVIMDKQFHATYRDSPSKFDIVTTHGTILLYSPLVFVIFVFVYMKC